MGRQGAPAADPEAGRQAVEELVVALGGTPGLAAAIDPARPLAIAFLDPGRHPSPAARPYAIALPVTSPEAFLRELESAFGRIATDRRDRHAFALPGGGHLHVAVRRDDGSPVAYVGFRPELAVAMAPLLDRVRARPPAGIVAHAALGPIREAYGEQLDSLVEHATALTAPAAGGDPQVVHGVRALRRAIPFLQDADTLELRGDAVPAGLTLAVRMEGALGTGFAAVVDAQRPGPLWGAELLPRETILFHATRMNPEGKQAEAADLAAYLASIAGDEATRIREERWRAAIAALGEVLEGEAIHGLWPVDQGGLGFGGAYRISAPAIARAHALDAYRALEPVLGVAATRQLGFEPGRTTLRPRIRRGAERIGGIPIDRVELRPRFGAGAENERRIFELLFGDQLTLGLAVTGEHLLWAAGRDWRPRLEGMIAAAAGEGGPSLRDAPFFERADAFRRAGRVSLAVVSTAGIAAFVRAVLAETRTATPQQELMLRPFLAEGRQDGAIVAATNVAARDGRVAYQVTTRVPAVLVGELGGLGSAMWRVALAPIAGPPPFPPIPAPPRNVTPPSTQAVPPDGGNVPPSSPDLPTGRGT